jgi:hypothetical protein
MRTVTVAGQQFQLTKRSIERAVARSLPEPVRDHFVVVSGRRWPPKQVLALATGLERADFTTHQARRILTRLGFSASRAGARRGGDAATSRGPNDGTRGGAARRGRSAPPLVATSPVMAAADASAEPATLADALRPFISQWVAVRGDEVLVAAPTPRQVVAWLAEHGQQAQSVFRVPGSEESIGGAAPL